MYTAIKHKPFNCRSKGLWSEYQLHWLMHCFVVIWYTVDLSGSLHRHWDNQAISRHTATEATEKTESHRNPLRTEAMTTTTQTTTKPCTVSLCFVLLWSLAYFGRDRALTLQWFHIHRQLEAGRLLGQCQATERPRMRLCLRLEYAEKLKLDNDQRSYGIGLYCFRWCFGGARPLPGADHYLGQDWYWQLRQYSLTKGQWLNWY